ncbi:hypothetical protein JCM8115_005570 [Rhodotorula mucilaginosa]
MPLARTAAAVTLYDHAASPLSPLVDLVKPFLPLPLPLYSTLLTPGVPLAVYATFKPGQVAVEEEPWLIIADLGNQLRFFCSVEGEREPLPERLQQAQALVGNGLRQYLVEHSRGRDRISIGAIPDIWRSVVRDTFGTDPFSASEIHYRRLQDLPTLPTNGAIDGGSTSSGDEFVTTEGRLEDVAEILSTSEVPHPPAYLETRLPYTTVLRSCPSNPSSPDGATSPPSSDKSPALPAPRGGKILAHCTTHRDGSIGTLHVSPSARRRGYGSLVFLARATRMRDIDVHIGGGAEGSGYVFSYVHRENESSNALMRRCGMDKSEYEVWWARVKLPLSSSLPATGEAP